ncbi:MAG: DNA repair protein RadA [Desulfovibrio sp.]|uniref:DNA repair protein RadA n=1 Tax=Desulfovibrio sp. 7SRBS1 TaxID=3378064 RepID=UPI003B3C281D
MKKRAQYACSACGAVSPRWSGQCPRCGQWNTMAEEPVSVTRLGSKASSDASLVRPVALEDLPVEDGAARPTGMDELDAFLGGGLVPGAALLLGGEPGIGKSTLLIQLAGQLAAQGRSALYVSGEESLSQLRGRAERLGLLGPGLTALSGNNADDVAALMRTDKPELVIVDSVQTMATSQADSIPGSVSQVRAVSSGLVEEAKKSGCALILVGHVTKDGQIAGPRLMEHMVDTVLYLEGDRRHVFRILRVLKNRFGPTDELLVLQMRPKGLEVVPDPSTFFLGARDAGQPGAAVVMAVDGHRPFAVEVQALASKSFLSVPRRTALGFDQGRLNLLLAVIEKHLRLNFGQFDVYAKIGGGLKLADPGLDLGIVASLLSSFYDTPLPEGAVFWGEVDLSGQIRPVSGHEVRFKQADRLGYGPILHSGSGVKGVKRLEDFQKAVFGRG